MSFLKKNSGPALAEPAVKTSPLSKANRIIGIILTWAYRLRKIVLAVPVVFYALKLAAFNSSRLPEIVGLNLQADGTFTMEIARSVAVMGPLALTGGCLFMMFLARKSLYAWAISLFTLALPILLYVSNVYPA